MTNSIGALAVAAANDVDGDPAVSSFEQRSRRATVPGFLDIGEVAALFGRAPRTIRWWLATGRLPAVRIGRTPFVPETELRKLLGQVGDCEPNSGRIDGYQEVSVAAENHASDGAEI